MRRRTVAVRRPGSAGRSARTEGRRRRRAHRLRTAGVAVLAVAGAALALSAALTVAGAGPLGARTGPSRAATALFVLAGLAGLAALLVRPERDPGRWARGADGEVATAAVLDRLSPRRWAVLHDLAVPGSRANIDHLVIGPTGVWVIDSKAYRGTLSSRRGRLRAGNVTVSTEAVRWEAEVVSEVLGERVRPLVAVHGQRAGQRLGRRGRSCGGARAVGAPRLLARLRRGRFLRPVLSPGRVRELAAIAESRLH